MEVQLHLIVLIVKRKVTIIKLSHFIKLSEVNLRT